MTKVHKGVLASIRTVRQIAAGRLHWIAVEDEPWQLRPRQGVQQLTKGETITEDGEYYSYDQVKLAHSAPDLKVLTAVVQAKSMELTAQIADGFILSVLGGRTMCGR